VTQITNVKADLIFQWHMMPLRSSVLFHFRNITNYIHIQTLCGLRNAQILNCLELRNAQLFLETKSQTVVIIKFINTSNTKCKTVLFYTVMYRNYCLVTLGEAFWAIFCIYSTCILDGFLCNCISC